MTNENVILRQTQGDLGTRFLGATLSSDGTLVIRGQDIGRGVEQFYGDGNTEYEWTWTLGPDSVVRFAKSVGCDSVLDGLVTRFSGDESANLKMHLDANGIKYDTWSRIGN